MVRKNIQIVNQLGLHARAAAKFVQTACRFNAFVEIARNNKRVNGKSILGVMMLAASKNTWVEILANGQDEEQALHALEELVKSRFGEEK